jgi:GNAT superfamily N-acetyltransferase
MHIRAETPNDYPAVVEIVNRTRPEHPITLDDLLYGDAHREPHIRSGRWVAEEAGRVVGLCSYDQYADLYHPRKFWVSVRVHPDFQRRGIGAALYYTLLDGLRPLDPLALQVAIREDRTGALRFAEVRGFREYSRRWEARLDVFSFDAAPYAALRERLKREGIRLRSFAELADDPDRDRKFEALQWALDQDVPIDEPITRRTFEQFRREVIEHPRFVSDGTFVALDGDAYIGLMSFFRTNQPDTLDIDLTGTLPAYRRRGIATLLKVQGVEWARANGYQTIIVFNDLPNTGMLAINDRMGFVRQPAQLQLAKTFEDAR